MILATGWTHAELLRQPAPVVRSLIWRLWTERIWKPAIMDAARGPVPNRTAFASLGDWAEARRGKAAASEYADLLSAALWPEDDDG